MLILLFSLVYSANFDIPFTSAYNSYQIRKSPEENIFKSENELFIRNKCKSCCKVAFVSNHDFNDGNYYAMDMEFDDKRSIRLAEGNYEQCILLRPLNPNNELQHFELNSYKMINMFASPKRVHDIRNGIVKGNKLIIWKKKEPLLVSTNNQRFVYTHPYSKNYYNDPIYVNYPKHFYAPYYTTEPVCYEVHFGNHQRWTGNKNLNVIGKSYQIKINGCKDSSTQEFVPIFI